MIGGDGLLDDFIPIVHQFDHDIIIYPVFDLHVGDERSNIKEWFTFKKMILSDPRNHLIIGGDSANNATKNGKSDSYGASMRPREQKEWLTREIRDLADRIICVNPGNHEERSKKEVDDEMLYDACLAAGIEDRYRENAAFVIIRMGRPEGAGTKNPTYTLCSTHGTGGGALTGGAVNKNERFGMVMDGVDALITGHVHKGAITRPKKIVFDAHNKKISMRDFVCVISTSWLEYGGYSLRLMLTPASTTRQKLILYRKHKQIEAIW